jgi:hypothetical protein
MTRCGSVEVSPRPTSSRVSGLCCDIDCAEVHRRFSCSTREQV